MDVNAGCDFHLNIKISNKIVKSVIFLNSATTFEDFV